MNIKYILVLFALSLLVSCGKVFDEEDITANVSFTIKEYTKTDFGNNYIERATPIESFNRISLFLSANGKGVQSINQTKNDTGFGIIKMEIPFGTVQIMVVGHNSSGNTVFTNTNGISFIDDKVTDTFYYFANLTVDDKTPTKMTIELNRVVAKFELLATDNIPQGVSTIEFTAIGGGDKLNPYTGKSSELVEQSRTLEVPSNFIGTSNNKFSLYTFLPEEETDMKITVRAKNSKKETIFEQTFEEVPMQINRITRYKGEFFRTGANVTQSMTVNNTWKSDLEKLF